MNDAPPEVRLTPSAESARLRADINAEDAMTRAYALLNAAECSGCAFMDTTSQTCRAWPPRPLADGRPVWPKVKATDWCGCWRAL
jgi:hypothetical protein